MCQWHDQGSWVCLLVAHIMCMLQQGGSDLWKMLLLLHRSMVSAGHHTGLNLQDTMWQIIGANLAPVIAEQLC